ncbi:MAG: YfiR family protein [Deltaproteobacteria bacterium]|nr:YfiR family protein [Deltaproteobacteria bacterium]
MSRAGRPLRVRRLTTWSEARTCRAAFIGQRDGDRIEEELRELAPFSVLTLADTPGYGERGVMVNLYLEEERVRFEINLFAARQAHLQLSSKLLSLARLVGPTTSRGEP